MSDCPPSPEDLDRAQRMLRILDAAYLAVSTEYKEGDWDRYLDIVREEAPELEDAQYIVALLVMRDAGTLMQRGASPSASWSNFYETWGRYLE